MSIIDSIRSYFKPEQKPEQRAITYSQGVQAGLISGPNRSGIVVNEESALGVSAIFCAIKVISESIGSFPLVIYEKSKDGSRKRAEDHPLYPVLHDEPNPEMTRPVFFETLMSHALLWGTAFAEVVRDGSGNPVELFPIHPSYVTVLRNTTTGELYYQVILPFNVIGNPKDIGNKVILRQEDVLAIPGISHDGSVGYSLLRTARDNIGYSIACDRFGSAFFGNMARLGGTLETPNRLSDEARENLKKSFQNMHGGVDKVGTTALLEEGLKYVQNTFSNEAGIYQESRSFQITEVCRLFNLSPIKCHELGRATWNNISVLNTDFFTTTLRPWCEKIECEIERKLLKGSPYYVEFLADALLRGDTATRYSTYQTGLAAGFLTVDEVREMENLPPMPAKAIEVPEQKPEEVDQGDD